MGMRTGDTVIHRPTSETWLVAWADDETGYMSPCGWPTCQARISDCDIIEVADDQKSARLVDEVARSGRTDAAKAVRIAARAALKAEER